MRGIEPDRAQQRLDLAPEIVGDPSALRGVATGVPQQAYARSGHRRQHLAIQRVIDLGDQRVRLFAQPRIKRAQLMQRHAGRRCLDAELLAHAGHADLEKFVQIAADDAQEAQALEQRDGSVLRQREDPTVEREQRKLAIDQLRRRRLDDGFGRHRDIEAPWDGRCGESAHFRTQITGMLPAADSTASARHRPAPLASRSSSTR
jgi:hypothetical protein